MSKAEITAAALAIGDELLSGRTRDKNINHLAQTLTSIGITLHEVRIIQDNEQAIIKALNALREQYDYIFTSGGIGPTHDDITAEAISKALELECVYDDKAMTLLANHYKTRDLEFTAARQRMARMPKGAGHINNPISKAPGFNIENIYVLAGVPKIFEAMLDHIVPTLKTGQKIISKSVHCRHGEGIIGTPLADIQKKYCQISIGSYPRFEEKGGFSTDIIVRGLEKALINKVVIEIRDMLKTLN